MKSNGTNVPSNFANLAAVRTAMLSKLAESTLDAADARRLQLQPHTAADVKAKLHDLTFYRAGFKIPYFSLQGRPTTFFRFRYLEYSNGRGFAKLTHSNGNGTKPVHGDVRYVQPAATRPELYYPPHIEWPQIANDVSQYIVITEGELKAACASKHGLPTLGLGGVWSWKSKKEGVYLLPSFKDIRWSDTVDGAKGKEQRSRVTYICFDSDAVNNPQVCMAQNALAYELLMLGADVYVCKLEPLPDGRKCGLDDYIAAHGVTTFCSRVLDEAAQYRAAEELHRLNNEVVYVKDPGHVIELATSMRMAPDAFSSHHYANRIWHTTNAAGNQMEKQAAKEWIKWPYRSQVARATYAPGGRQFTVAGEFNTWAGWGCQPKQGDVSVWHEAIEYLFADHEDAAARARWFQQWLAYPLQYAGAKLSTAAVMWSVEQGTGKSMIGYAMRAIYGQNFTEIGNRHLESPFNEWAENKQFVMGDEISCDVRHKRDVSERMKSMITQRELRLNPKYIKSYTVPDCVNYYFTSNQPDALAVTATDRRYFVNEILRPKKSQEFYKAFWQRFIDEGNTGASALMHYLLHLDLTGFDPNGEAPLTSSKQDMQRQNNLGPNEQFAYDLRYSRSALNNNYPRADGRVLFTYSDLVAWGNSAGVSNKTEEELKRGGPCVDEWLWKALRKQNFRKAYRGNPVHGVRSKLWGTRASDYLWVITADHNLASQYAAINDGRVLAHIYLTDNGFRPKGKPPTLPTWYAGLPSNKFKGA